MKSLDAYEKEVFSQPQYLKIFQPQTKLSVKDQQNSVFSGNGDSLISAMLAEVFSNYNIKALDPMELSKNQYLLKHKKIFFISISGNTVSNIVTSKKTKKSVAITLNPKSLLAKSCNKVLILNYPKSGVFTSGSIGFLASTMTCISLVKKIGIPKNPKIFKKAYSDAKNSTIVGRIFVLGNDITFPIAMYCAAKFYEVLGFRVNYVKFEQFSHMEIFSVKKGDTVIIFGKKNSAVSKLIKKLRKIGIYVINPKLNSKNQVAVILYYIYYSQMVPLFEAKRKRKQECNFILSKKLLQISDEMIY